MIKALGIVALAAAVLFVAAPALASTSDPILDWSPTASAESYDFGVLDAGAGATNTVTFTLTNSGGRASGAIRLSLPQPSAFTVSDDGCTGTSLGPGKSCEVSLTYAPTSSGQVDNATLTVTATQAEGSLALKGEAGSPSLGWSPASHDFGAVDAGDSVNHGFTLTNSGAGTSASLTTSLTGSTAMSITSDGCDGTVLAPGASCGVTVAYAPTAAGTDNGTLAAGGASASLTGSGATLEPLAATIGVSDCLGGIYGTGTLSPTVTTIVDGSADACLAAQVDNVPAAGVTYQWEMITPNTVGYLFNPIQTTASVLLPANSVPDFTPESVVVVLTVTPKGGGSSVTVSGRVLYRNSGVTVAAGTCFETKSANVTPQASASTIPLSGSLTITQSFVDNRSLCGDGVPISGTVTYSTEAQSLGTSTSPLDPFVVQGSDLGAGSHTITVTYAIWNGVAYAPYSVDIPVTVTP